MALAELIYAKLLATSAVTDLVGGADAPGPRIYPNQAPPSPVAPYVIFNDISSDPFSTHGEATQNQQDLIQFACFAATYVVARDLRDAVVAALDNVALQAGGPIGILETSRTDYEPAVELHRCDADMMF
jgi:hypothetical protein